VNKGALLRPYSFKIIVMRIFIFILISSLFHFVLLQYFYFTFDEVPIVNKQESLSVMLLNNNLLNSKRVTQNINQVVNTGPVKVKKESGLNIQAKDTSLVRGGQHEEVVLNPNQESIQLKDYFPNTEVDRKALPQMNIDQSMLANEGSSGLPIKLRLYINSLGRVVKVEPIAVLDQDVFFAEKLSSLLYEVRFLPAKRESLDVNSYQDLQLSFNPIATPGDHHIESD
jgi:hypothetical protein